MGRIFNFGELELRINWLIALCVLLTMAGFIRLGIWQLDRAQEQISRQAAYQEMGQQQATPIDSVPTAGLEFDRFQHQNRLVSLAGHYLNEQSVFLIYQIYQEQLGFEVVTPVMIDELDLIVMVSRGWSGISTPETLAAALPAIEGQVQLEGQIYVPTPTEAARNNPVSSDTWPRVMRYLNMGELEPAFSTDIFPYVVRLAENQPGVLVRHWPTVFVDTQQNFSYALQWFAMAIAVFITSLILSSNILKLIQRRLKPI